MSAQEREEALRVAEQDYQAWKELRREALSLEAENKALRDQLDRWRADLALIRAQTTLAGATSIANRALLRQRP